MSNTFFNIESAFQTKLNSVVGKPYIDFEGTKTYTPILGVRWWRTTNLPTNSRQVTADALKQHTGVYQIDTFQPLGKGLADVLKDIDLLATTFDTVNSLVANDSKVQILGVSRGQVLREDAWLHGFVKINYVCYSN